MNRALRAVLPGLALVLFALSVPVAAHAAPPTARAYAPENLRSLSRDDQVRVIGLEYREQSDGRRIPDDQLRFYLDQVERSGWGFSQVKRDIARSLAGGGDAPGALSIRCESDGGRERSCATPWAGRSRLVRQLSDAACIEGHGWRSQRGRVLVSGGCRGEFAEAGDDGPAAGRIRCESTDGRSRSCATPWQARSRLVRQLSDTDCIEGRNWRSQRGQVFVSGGCRAEFAAGRGEGPAPGSIRCESEDGHSRFCTTPWRGHSRLLRQLSDAPCVRGRSWQSQAGRVFVSGGCRGEFAAAHGVPGGPGTGDDYLVTCASTGDRPQSCAWNAPGRRPYVQRQISSTRCRENGNWWYDGHAVWVRDGCRAVFGAR